MLQNRLGKELLIFDGAMGTQLQNAGLNAGDIPEELNIDRPDLLRSIHKNYLKAGADFITTNTFGCNRLKMEEAKYEAKDMLLAAVENARAARTEAGREDDSYIVLDIGPIGQLLEPMGTLTFDEAYDIILEQVETVKDQVDLVLFETMSDLYEVKAGVLAVKEHTDLPVFVTMTFEQNGRTLSGNDPETFINVAEGLGVDALGVNCSLGPDELKPIIDEILEKASVPVMLQPNAGLPCLEHGETHYHVTPEEYVESRQNTGSDWRRRFLRTGDCVRRPSPPAAHAAPPRSGRASAPAPVPAAPRFRRCASPGGAAPPLPSALWRRCTAASGPAAADADRSGHRNRRTAHPANGREGRERPCPPGAA